MMKESSESPERNPVYGSEPTLSNTVSAIRRERLVEVWSDTFLVRIMTVDPSGEKPREWQDADDLKLCIRLQQSVAGFSKVKIETVRHAVKALAYEDRRNVVRDWLNSLNWDEEPRIDYLFEKYFGAVPTEYSRAASKNFMLSMVARIFQPGCQADHMIILEGDQGVKKSTGLQAIGGDWYFEQHVSATKHKEFAENLQGKMLVEISELDAFRKTEITSVKATITDKNDRYREPWARHSTDHPRQSIFAGTTNASDWNHDASGARRFWPIECRGEIKVESLRIDREQLFAEAVCRYKCGEMWWEMPIEETRRQQERRYTPPPWCEFIQFYFEYEFVVEEDDQGNKTKSWKKRETPLTEVSIPELMFNVLDIPKAQCTKAKQMEVADCLKYLGWKKKDKWNPGTKVRIGYSSKGWYFPHQGGEEEEGGDA